MLWRDISRKNKLLEKQKAGRRGCVSMECEHTAEAFIAALRLGKSDRASIGWREFAPIESVDRIGDGDRFGAMRNDDAGDAQGADRVIDPGLERGVEMGRALIHQEERRPPIQGAGEQKALFLPARKA